MAKPPRCKANDVWFRETIKNIMETPKQYPQGKVYWWPPSFQILRANRLENQSCTPCLQILLQNLQIFKSYWRRTLLNRHGFGPFLYEACGNLGNLGNLGNPWEPLGTLGNHWEPLEPEPALLQPLADPTRGMGKNWGMCSQNHIKIIPGIYAGAYVLTNPLTHAQNCTNIVSLWQTNV